ncbi:MAG: hypothetical protein U0L49_06560 [Eubacterium sp.]|nr:hypothetical protein [Eubacterium sp.]
MYIKQISVFLENKKGRLDQVLGVLGDAGIDLLSVSLADTSDFGVLRLIAKEPEKAKKILTDAGITSRIDEVIAVVVPDAPGSLQKVLGMLNEGGIDISYIYGLSIDGPGAPIAIKTSNQAKAAQILDLSGVKTIMQAELDEL